MKPFYFFLMVLWGMLAFYTGQVIVTEGWSLFPIFFGDIAAWKWPGQFNLDFTMMLILAASWTVWRNGATPGAWLLGLVALFGGAGFMLPYLTYLAARNGGNTAAILLGVNAKDRMA